MALGSVSVAFLNAVFLQGSREGGQLSTPAWRHLGLSKQGKCFWHLVLQSYHAWMPSHDKNLSSPKMSHSTKWKSLSLWDPTTWWSQTPLAHKQSPIKSQKLSSKDHLDTSSWCDERQHQQCELDLLIKSVSLLFLRKKKEREREMNWCIMVHL